MAFKGNFEGKVVGCKECAAGRFQKFQAEHFFYTVAPESRVSKRSYDRYSSASNAPKPPNSSLLFAAGEREADQDARGGGGEGRAMPAGCQKRLGGWPPTGCGNVTRSELGLCCCAKRPKQASGVILLWEAVFQAA